MASNGAEEHESRDAGGLGNEGAVRWELGNIKVEEWGRERGDEGTREHVESGEGEWERQACDRSVGRKR